MYIEIDFQSTIPIYQQLRDAIVLGIATGQLKEEESLPSVRQLAADLGVNLHTINKAYNQLKSEGFIAIDRRKGATILPLPEEISEEDLKKTKEEIRLSLATAHCRGLSDKDLLDLTKELLLKLKGVSHE